MKNFVYTLLFCLISFQVAAQQEVSRVGTSGAQFLKIGVGARACALGETMVAVRGDVTGLYWNPAGIASIESKSLTASQNELFVGLNYNFLGLVMPVGRASAMGLHILYLASGEMEVTTVAEPDGTGSYFSWQDFSIGLTYAAYVTDRLSLGGTVKYIREETYGENAHTFAIDLGALLDTGIMGCKLGLSMSNIGEKMRFSSPDTDFGSADFFGNSEILAELSQLKTEQFSLPLVFRLGLSTELLGKNSYFFRAQKNRVLINLEANDPNDAILRSNFGIEYEWNSLLYLRLGYRGVPIEHDPVKSYSTGSYSMGLGLKYKIKSLSFRFDYAYVDYKLLGTAHHFTLGLVVP